MVKAAPAGPLIRPSPDPGRQARACGWRRSRAAAGQGRPGSPAAAARSRDVLAGRAGSGMPRSSPTTRAGRVGHQLVIPSPDLMAITPCRGRKLGKFGRRFRGKLRPQHDVIETPSGDGMTTKQSMANRRRKQPSDRIRYGLGNTPHVADDLLATANPSTSGR